jgi:hypothetical protein
MCRRSMAVNVGECFWISRGPFDQILAGNLLPSSQSHPHSSISPSGSSPDHRADGATAAGPEWQKPSKFVLFARFAQVRKIPALEIFQRVQVIRTSFCNNSAIMTLSHSVLMLSILRHD